MKSQKSLRRLFIASLIMIAFCASLGFALPSLAQSSLVQDFTRNLSASLAGNSSGSKILGQYLENPPAVATDRANYLPGETIAITGSGWTPGETVSIDLWQSSKIE